MGLITQELTSFDALIISILFTAILSGILAFLQIAPAILAFVLFVTLNVALYGMWKPAEPLHQQRP